MANDSKLVNPVAAAFGEGCNAADVCFRTHLKAGGAVYLFRDSLVFLYCRNFNKWHSQGTQLISLLTKKVE